MSKQRWAVARDTHSEALGLSVLSWHRWRWQAYRARQPGFFTASREEVDASWHLAEQIWALQAEEVRRRWGAERARLALRGGSRDLDGRV